MWGRGRSEGGKSGSDVGGSGAGGGDWLDSGLGLGEASGEEKEEGQDGK